MDFHDLKEKFLTCEICFNYYDCQNREPRVLSCHHSFCAECLEELGSEGRFQCPVCRVWVPFNRNLAASRQFPLDRTLTDLLEWSARPGRSARRDDSFLDSSTPFVFSSNSSTKPWTDSCKGSSRLEEPRRVTDVVKFSDIVSTVLVVTFFIWLLTGTLAVVFNLLFFLTAMAAILTVVVPTSRPKVRQAVEKSWRTLLWLVPQVLRGFIRTVNGVGVFLRGENQELH